MLSDRVSNPGPLTYESGALHDPAGVVRAKELRLLTAPGRGGGIKGISFRFSLIYMRRI